MAIELSGTVGEFGNILAAIGALGTAAFGLVDATKVYKGGVSNIGFGFIDAVLEPYLPALRLVNAADPLATVRGNWLNGVAKGEQKAKVKALIRLGITAETAASLALAAPGVEPAALKEAARKVDAGEALTDTDINVLGRFDAILDAQMDAGFERADQQYRNASRVIASGFAIALALIGMWIVRGTNTAAGDFALAFLIGVVATPLAPIAKDVASALGTAVSALKAAKG